MVNFKEIKEAYRSNPLGILTHLIPNGRVEGHDYVVKNPNRSDSRSGSFRIDIDTCRFHDFATGDKGSGVIDLAMFVYGCDAVAVAKKLDERRTIASLAGDYQKPAKKRKIDPIYIWKKSFESEDHNYLKDKQITIGNAKVNEYKGEKKLVIPLTDEDMRIKGLQLIRENGDKSFPLPFKGLFHRASEYEYNTDLVVITEGYATARSVCKATSLFVIAAMSACNLTEVALKIRRLYPHSRIVIAADNDATGDKAAKDAVQELGNHNVQIIYPTHGNDFNDALIKIGTDNLNSQIMNQIGKEIIRV